jgi:hypothetical protein
MTNWELAQAMARLGAVTASALDSGGSTTMAFDGRLLNRPSDPGGERLVAETLAVLYTGVYAAQPKLPVVSPNGDGIAEQQQLSYKVVRPSTVTATLKGPGGVTGFTETTTRGPGVYSYTWPTATARRRQVSPLGRWQWVVSATDTSGQQSSIVRAFWLNDTLGYMNVAPRAAKLRRRLRSSVVAARFKLAYKARVTPTIWTRYGVLVRRLPARNLSAGSHAIPWNGRFSNGRPVYGGRYVFKVFAQNAYGPVALNQQFTILR